jgi:hypothetical protein
VQRDEIKRPTAVSSGKPGDVEPWFQGRLIATDPDNDKFAAFAIAAEAEWIVTDDPHFDLLKSFGRKPHSFTPGG